MAEKRRITKYSNLMVNFLLFKYQNKESNSILKFNEGQLSEKSIETMSSNEIDELLVTNILYKFRNFVHENLSTFKYYGQNCSEITSWTFPSTLLFTFTMVSTIG